MKVRELLLPLAVVAMIVGMVLPLPSALLDVFLIVNLLLATALLLSALSVNDPIKLSALPTILLLATLYRLTLNISTTRLILTGGDAGQVVASFGSVVIGGSVAVGLVVFLIITLIQFIVIAKGAERIAEVAARFTLDALPGKQMSVDADMRSGLIDVERAREKREELQVESRFYGALDGSMKFVKGDAIAGLIIVFINILGGVAVGLLAEHLTIAQAFQKFVTLTIGDGLVSQIPALLNSLTAGIIVTKVARNEDSSVVNELLAQIGQGQMVKGIVCFVSLLMGCLPGMPTIPFIVIGITLMFMRRAPVPVVAENSSEPVFQPKMPALITVIAQSGFIEKIRNSREFALTIDHFRQKSFDQYGILLPRIDYLIDDHLEQYIEINFRGARVAQVQKDGQDSFTEQLVVAQLDALVERYRTDIIDDIHTRRLIDFFEPSAPELVSSVIPQVVSITQLTVVMRALSRDRICLKQFDVILQALAEAGVRAANDRYLLEEVRIALGRFIVSRFATGEDKLRVLSLDPLVDLAFVEAERGSKIVDPKTIEDVLSFLEAIESEIPLITSRGSRALVAECLRARGQERCVIAYEEVPAAVTIETVQVYQLLDQERERILVNGANQVNHVV